MIKEKLAIHKQYLVISAPVPFRLIANNGTDFVERPAGVWQLDTYKLLPEKFMRNYPVFNLELEYDESNLEDGFNFEYYFTNINLGDSLKGVSGELVELSSVQFDTVLNELDKVTDTKGKLALELTSKKIDGVFSNIVIPSEYQYFTDGDKYRIKIEMYRGEKLEQTKNFYLIPKSTFIFLMDFVADPLAGFYVYFRKYSLADQGMIFYPPESELIQESMFSFGSFIDSIKISFYKI